MKLKNVWVVFTLIGLTAFYFAEALFFNVVLTFRDLGRYFYPLRDFTVTSIKGGVLPLWNPYIFCGTPHLALQQSAIFYPPSIIYYIFKFDFAFNLFLIFHVFLAGLFTFSLCRHWKLRTSSSLVAAITFMFSGYIVSMINLPTTLSSVIWLPLILLFFDKGLSETRPKYVLLAAVFLAVMFLGGEPSIAYSTSWVLLFYAVFFWLNNRGTCPFKRAFSYFFMAGTVSLLLVLFQALPFFELLALSDRTISPPTYAQLTTWSFSFRDVFSFFVPFLGRTDFSKDSYWREQSWVLIVYLGVFAALLVLVSLFFTKDRRIRFLYFIGTLYLFMAMGSYTPFYYFVYKVIPGFRFVRYPVRFLYVTTFAISVICGSGFNVYLEGRARGDERLKKFFGRLLYPLFIFAIIFLVLQLYRNELITAVHSYCLRFGFTKDSGVLLSMIAAMHNVGRFLAFFAAGGLLLFLGTRLKIQQGILSFAFISLMLTDIFSAAPPSNLVSDPRTLRAPTANVNLLVSDNSYFRFILSPKTRKESSFLEGQTYEEALRNGRNMLLANWPMLDGLYDVSGYDSIRLANYEKVMRLIDSSRTPHDTKMLDMLNTKYVVSNDKIDDKGYVLMDDQKVYLYKNTNVMPRAYLVDNYTVIKNETDIANRLKSKDFDPSREVILEEGPPLESLIAFSSKLKAQSSKHDSVNIAKYSPNEVVIKASVRSGKFLVLADTYYPGWKASVDGKPAHIYKANYMLRAVFLEPGEHEVRFSFQPFSFKLGLVLTILTLVILLFYIVIMRR